MLPLLFALVVSVPAPPVLASTSLVMSKAGDAVVSVTVNDSQFPAATALDILVDGGRTPGGLPSTLLDATREPPVVLRRGAHAWPHK